MNGQIKTEGPVSKVVSRGYKTNTSTGKTIVMSLVAATMVTSSQTQSIQPSQSKSNAAEPKVTPNSSKQSTPR